MTDWLDVIQARVDGTTPGPWRAWIEGRDQTSGDTFIQTGGEDIYLTGATQEDHDFIAHARQDIPRLIDEVRRLQQLLRISTP